MAGHGSRPQRGLESTAQSSVQSAKFGRMFRWLEPALAPQGPAQEAELRAVLEELSGHMVTDEFTENLNKPSSPGEIRSPDAPPEKSEPDDENPFTPAGYTYFGQFVDHDITFDPASSLQRLNDPDALEDFRTPRLDLDSLYGRGPDDQPYLYQRGPDKERVRFVVGPDRGVNGKVRRDLHRSEDDTALIGDKRNDENKIVAQVHALFLSFHNRVYDLLEQRDPQGRPQTRFLEAQRIVRWCYQWIVLNDFLPRICDPRIVAQVMPANGYREPQLQFYRPRSGDAYIPVEFAVAAYRFGHSMVRPSYSLNAEVISGTGTFGDDKIAFARIPVFVPHSRLHTDAMNGFGEALPAKWGIDWDFFLGTVGTAKTDTPQIPQPSYRIDAFLVDPLGNLPEFAVPTMRSPFASLAFRNLQRSVSMGLPSGQSVARMMGAKDVLSDDDLWLTRNKNETVTKWPEGAAFFAKDNSRRWLAGAAPLWYYILKEAEVQHHGHHLGEVGSRIVAETLIGLAWYDRYSYLYQMPLWNPSAEELGLSAKLDLLGLTRFVDGVEDTRRDPSPVRC